MGGTKKQVSAPQGRKKAGKGAKRKVVPKEIREARRVELKKDWPTAIEMPLWFVYASQWGFGIGCYSKPWDQWTPGYWNDLQDEYGVSDRIRRRYEAVFKVLKARVERMNRKAATKK